jgi:hypothetical protein
MFSLDSLGILFGNVKLKVTQSFKLPGVNGNVEAEAEASESAAENYEKRADETKEARAVRKAIVMESESDTAVDASNTGTTYSRSSTQDFSFRIEKVEGGDIDLDGRGSWSNAYMFGYTPVAFATETEVSDMTVKTIDITATSEKSDWSSKTFEINKPVEDEPTPEPEPEPEPQPEPQPPVRPVPETVDVPVTGDDPVVDVPEEPTPLAEEPAVEIPEEPTPLAEEPAVEIPEEPAPLAEEPEIEIDEEPVPLAEEPEIEIDEEPVPLADIPDMPTPLANVPQTGDESITALWGVMAAVSLMGIAFLTLGGKRREEV